MLRGSDKNLPEGGMQMYVKWAEREMKPCHRYLNALHPISLPLFAGLPNPANLFVMYDLPTLQNISRFSIRAWPLKLGGVEDS